MIHTPSLRGKPIGIQQKNLVVTSNYEARSLGVEKLMPVNLAKQICPTLILIFGEDLKKYRDMSQRIYQTLQTFSPLVEKLGLDENFIDVSELVSNMSPATEQLVGHIYKSENESCQCGCKARLIKGSIIAQEIRDRLKEELEISCCAGIAHNKLLAKLVCATHKPNQQTTLLPAFSLALIGSLDSPRNIPGIGSSTYKKLESLEIDTIRKLQSADIAVLSQIFGTKTANLIQELSCGIDQRQVRITDKPKSIGAEDGFPTVTTLVDIQVRMRSLLQRVWPLVEKDGRRPSQIRLTVRKLLDHPTKHSIRESRQTLIDPFCLAGVKKLVPLNSVQESKMLATLESLFNKIIAGAIKWQVTLVGISFTGLPIESPQKNSIQKYFGTSSSQEPCTSTRRHSEIESKEEKVTKEEKVMKEETVMKKKTVVKEETEIREEPATKRARYESNESKKCPAGIDPDVFRELPVDIQNELIAAHPRTPSPGPRPKHISQYFRRL